MNKEKIKFAVLLILQLLIGCIFIVSAVSKLLSIERLEFTLVENLKLPWSLAVMSSRLIVGFELIIGLCLVIFPKNIFIKKLTFFTLIGFTVYLVVLYLWKGDENDCGCFGELIAFTTLQSILKNIALLIINYLLFYQIRSEAINRKLKMLLFSGVVVISMSTVFYMAPIYTTDQKNNPDITLNWELLYNHPSNPKPAIDLKTGKHILAFLSTSCNHCKKASYKLGLLHTKYPAVSLYYVVNGYDEEITDFLKITRSETVNHNKFLGPEDFKALGGQTLPSILWIENGNVVFKKNIYEMTEEDFEKWVN